MYRAVPFQVVPTGVLESMHSFSQVWNVSNNAAPWRCCHYNLQGRMNKGTRAKMRCYNQEQKMLRFRSTVTMLEHSHLEMLQ